MYIKHVLARIYLVHTLFWVCVTWDRFSAMWTAEGNGISTFKVEESSSREGLNSGRNHGTIPMI